MHLVTVDGFPHGVRCGICNHVIPAGDVYTTSFDSITRGGNLANAIRHVGCEPIGG